MVHLREDRIPRPAMIGITLADLFHGILDWFRGIFNMIMRFFTIV